MTMRGRSPTAGQPPRRMSAGSVPVSLATIEIITKMDDGHVGFEEAVSSSMVAGAARLCGISRTTACNVDEHGYHQLGSTGLQRRLLLASPGDRRRECPPRPC